MWFGLAVVAWGHDLAGDVGYRPFVRDGELVAGWTSSGLVFRDADGLQGRVCNESLARVNDVWLGPDDVFLLATTDGLVRAPSAGCTREPDPTFAESLSMFRELDGVLVVVANRDEGDAILRSDGADFAPAGALPSPTDVNGMVTDGDGRWWVSGYGGGIALFASDDGGDTFVAVTPPNPEAFAVQALGVAPDGVGVVVSSWSLFGTAELWASSETGWQRIVELPLLPNGYGCVANRCFVSMDIALLTWDRAADPADTLALSDGPWTCLSVVDGALWGCNPRREPGLFASTMDGEAWTDVLAVSELEDRICPPGTDGDRYCTPATPFDTAVPPDDEDPPAELPVAKEGCGCASTGVGPWWAVVLLCWRRSRARPP